MRVDTHKLRSEEEQSEHNSIIATIRANLISQGLKVRDNPSNSKEFGVNGEDLEGNPVKYYPDVYTYDEKTRKTQRIYEVETKETVSKDSVAQWQLYAHGIADFYLVVPKKMLDKAKELVKNGEVEVKEYLTF